MNNNKELDLDFLIKNAKTAQKISTETNLEAANSAAETFLTISKALKIYTKEFAEEAIKKINKSFNVNFNLQTLKDLENKIEKEALEQLKQKGEEK